MTKKEILEIKKQFTLENNSIVRVASCHISGDGMDVHPSREFLNLTEEDACQYLKMLKKALSGNIGKNLFDIGFPPTTQGVEKEEFLMLLRDSRLQDDDLLQKFYDTVSETYRYQEDYAVILAYGVYDVPGSADSVYEYLLCSFCPVTLSKPGLMYDKQKGPASRVKDLWLEPPKDGFLYPAFNERAEDLHSLLYYGKKPADSQDELLVRLVGRERPLSEQEERDWFSGALAAAAGGECSYSKLMAVREHLEEYSLENLSDTPQLDKKEMEKILSSVGFSEKQVDVFAQEYDAGIGKGKSVRIASLTGGQDVSVKAYGTQIKAEPGTDIEAKLVNGRLCLIVPVDSGMIEVNGISCGLRSKNDDL